MKICAEFGLSVKCEEVYTENKRIDDQQEKLSISILFLSVISFINYLETQIEYFEEISASDDFRISIKTRTLPLMIKQKNINISSETLQLRIYSLNCLKRFAAQFVLVIKLSYKLDDYQSKSNDF